ncbi:NAD+ synthase, partial [bacterium]|nr:NAD+ synthase [bacterium]
LAVEALGRSNVLGVCLPHQQSSPASLNDAQTVAQALQITTGQIDITPFVSSFQETFPDMTLLQLGNVMARCRMISLYQISADEGALVLGTSNKSEILLGYGTLHGDLAAAFMPLGDLYKTQVRQLAEHLAVPEAILTKPPSADLWEGQSDEDEMGLTYAEADRFFIRWMDGRCTREELIEEGFSPEFTDKVMRRVQAQQFKRTLPPVPDISKLTTARDWQK